MKNHHISEAGVSFENIVWSVLSRYGLENIFYIWQQTIVLSYLVPFKSYGDFHLIFTN